MNAVNDFWHVLPVIAVSSDRVEDLRQTHTFHATSPEVEIVCVFEVESLSLREMRSG